MNSHQNLAFFLTATDSRDKLFKYYTKKDKQNFWTKLQSSGQEPTFKSN